MKFVDQQAYQNTINYLNILVKLQGMNIDVEKEIKTVISHIQTELYI